ncbi:MAG TPA: CHAP domain-containing protein [Candidatus Limnocylindrales bacterium]|nr:CHAP domain-containing protein [Candidatus Limnocylindrales bacterium]
MKTPSTWFSVQKTLVAVLSTAVLLVGIPVMTASASGDDYPFRGRPNIVDPWGFYTGYCTSFAAWRLSQHGVVFHGAALRGPNGRTARFGNGGNWDAAAAAVGFVVDTHPSVGAIAVWHGGEDHAWWGGHVAYVIGVNGANATVEEYNWSNYLRYGTRVTQAPRYIHFVPAGSAPAPQPQPPSQPVAAFFPTAGHPYRTTDFLRMRSGPSTRAQTIGFLGNGARIMIVCQTRSSSVINRDPIWDRLSNGAYVSDYYTTTPAVRTFSPGLPRC